MFVKKHSKGQVKSNSTGGLSMFKGYRKCAFTLAEVLVTLGIIGVVSAMTIPSLTQNWQKKAYVTQLHKVYNVVQQAFMTMINENNALNLAEAGFFNRSNCGAGVSENTFLHDNFKVVKDCGTNPSGCFASSYRNLNGQSFTVRPSGSIVAIAGGAAISFYIDGIDTGDYETDDYVGYMYVDVNGPKGPNINGRDLFLMYFFADGTLDAWRVNPACRKNGTSCYSGNSAKQARENRYNQDCKSATDASDGCFAKILNDNWEMNY